MKSSIIAMSVAAMLAFGVASAATPAAAPAPEKAKTAQQQKMSDCASANKGKKGDDYKNSVSSCMKASSATPAAKAMTPQQQKMSDCASANKGKKGDDYKNSVSACMKAASAAPPPAPATTPPTATKSKGAQQQKMADCATANKGKTGADYKSAMSACMKK